MERWMRVHRNALLLLVTLCLLSVGCESAATRYEKHIASGREYLAGGRLQEAILSLKSALAARPGDFDARRLLVECYLERGAEEPAKELLDAVAKERPDDPDIPLLDARLALLEDDPDRALDVLQAYMAIHGEVPAALVLVGNAHAAKKLWSEALQAYDLALEKDATNPQAWLGKASVLAQLKRDTEAEQAATHAVEGNPHLGRGYLLIGQLARAADRLDDACAAYTKAVDNDPRVELLARFGLGQALLAQKQFRDASAQGEALVKEYATRPEGYYLRGLARYMQSEWDDAASDFQTCLGKQPDHPGAQLYLALSQYHREQWEQALSAAKSLQAQRPGFQPVEMLLAELLLRTGDYQGAVAQARRALKRTPDSAFLYRVLGLALIQAGDSEGGAEALETAQRLSPSERLEFALGNLYFSMNQLEKAAAKYEALAASKSKGRDANVRLFFTRLRQGDVDGALGLLDNLQQDAPDEPMWLNLRGAALLAKNDRQGAEAVWKQALAVSPQSTAAHFNLGGLYKVEGRWQESRKEYQQVLLLEPKDPTAHRELASLDLRDGDIGAAIGHLESAQETSADSATALRLSTLYLRQGNGAAALAAAEKATELRPDLADGWIQEGIIALAQGDVQSGEASLRKASELAPESSAVWYHLGGIEAQRKNWAAARNDLKKAATIDPAAPEVVARRVRVEFAAGEKQAGYGLAAAFLKGHSDLPEAYRIAAAAAEVVGQPEQAGAVLARAREHFGEKPGILFLQAEFERRQGRLDTAEQLYSRILAIDPNAVPAALRKAGGELVEGKFEEAAGSYQAVLGIAPNHPVALNNLAYLYTDVLGKPAEALVLLKRVDPKVLSGAPMIRDTLGWAQLRSGDANGAVTTLGKVVDDMPDLAVARYHLGAALVAAGRGDEGRQELQSAVALGLPPAEEKAASSLLGSVAQAP